MGTHGCECYHWACISGFNFHLVCISGRMKEEAGAAMGSSMTVMKGFDLCKRSHLRKHKGMFSNEMTTTTNYCVSEELHTTHLYHTKQTRIPILIQKDQNETTNRILGSLKLCANKIVRFFLDRGIIKTFSSIFLFLLKGQIKLSQESSFITVSTSAVGILEEKQNVHLMGSLF